MNLRQLLEDRCLLDRRRFEEAFILFAALEVGEKYKIKLKSMPTSRNMIFVASYSLQVIHISKSIKIYIL